MARTKVLYIAGSNRCGSTLLARLLGDLPGFFPIGDGILHFFGGVVHSHVPCGCGVRVHDCPFWKEIPRPAEGLPSGARWLRLRRIPFLDSHFRRNPDETGRLIRLVGDFYDTIAQKTGASVIIDSSKNGLYGRFLSRVPNVDLYVLYLVRDPRGVVASHRQPKAWIPKASPFRATKRWLLATLGCEYLRAFVPNWQMMRYEDFVKAPRLSTLQIADFLGCRPDPFLGRSESSGWTVEVGTQHILGSNPDKLQRGPIKIAHRTAYLAWGSRTLVSALTAPLLWRYGYWGSHTEKHLHIAAPRPLEDEGEEPQLLEE